MYVYIYVHICIYTCIYIYTYMCRHPHGPPRDSFAPSVKTLGFEVAGWPAICATGVAGIYTYIYDKYIYILFVSFVLLCRGGGLAAWHQPFQLFESPAKTPDRGGGVGGKDVETYLCIQ